MRRMVRPLDRYVLVEFLKILAATAIGVPVLVIVIDVTENLDKYIQRNLKTMDIVQAYLYGVPETMFLVLPASVLFATVFAIGGFTRHSELTAAKASGISFHRFIAPIAAGAVLATFVGLLLSAITPVANSRRDEKLQERKSVNALTRSNFTFLTEEGRVYKIYAADVGRKTLDAVEIDRKGRLAASPGYFIFARSALWARKGGWMLKSGVLHVITGDSTNFTVAFDSLRDRHFREEPFHLMADTKAPEEMGWSDLGAFIVAMERSGSDVNKLRTARMLKLAIPVTCIIIMMFGAPLATSNQRGGAAFGAAVSLGTTVVFLMLLQLTQAIGDKGIVQPELAAWLPGILFGLIGAVLLARVRT